MKLVLYISYLTKKAPMTSLYICLLFRILRLLPKKLLCYRKNHIFISRYLKYMYVTDKAKVTKHVNTYVHNISTSGFIEPEN